jgi:hypothetical protein
MHVKVVTPRRHLFVEIGNAIDDGHDSVPPADRKTCRIVVGRGEPSSLADALLTCGGFNAFRQPQDSSLRSG